mmetsp:Transcript_592/g.909  ORF Transcript_592/g.909 Transcript_592/m.909 type:complete len:87 (+) Transcript_592:1393-1653(+)
MALEKDGTIVRDCFLLLQKEGRRPFPSCDNIEQNQNKFEKLKNADHFPHVVYPPETSSKVHGPETGKCGCTSGMLLGTGSCAQENG